MGLRLGLVLGFWLGLGLGLGLAVAEEGLEGIEGELSVAFFFPPAPPASLRLSDGAPHPSSSSDQNALPALGPDTCEPRPSAPDPGPAPAPTPTPHPDCPPPLPAPNFLMRSDPRPAPSPAPTPAPSPAPNVFTRSLPQAQMVPSRDCGGGGGRLGGRYMQGGGG